MSIAIAQSYTCNFPVTCRPAHFPRKHLVLSSRPSVFLRSRFGSDSEANITTQKYLFVSRRLLSQSEKIESHFHRDKRSRTSKSSQTEFYNLVLRGKKVQQSAKLPRMIGLLRRRRHQLPSSYSGILRIVLQQRDSSLLPSEQQHHHQQPSECKQPLLIELD